MEDSSCVRRLLNPCLLHLQKMELELRCPACLKFFDTPVLLPCAHMCCRSCVVNSENQKLCPACKLPALSAVSSEPMVIPHVEAIVTIFRSMNASFSSLLKPGFRSAVIEAQPSNGQMTKISDHKLNTQSSMSGRVVSADGGEPCSSPSFGDMKVSDDGSTHSGNYHKLPCNFSCKRKAVGEAADKTLSRVESTPENPSLDRRVHLEDLHLNASRTCLDTNNADPARELKKFKVDSTFYDNVGKSSNNSEPKDSENFATDVPMTNSLSMPCAFCHSSTVSEFTGPFLHYDDNGNPLDNKSTFPPDTLHVHEKCIDWAPQIYFDRDTAKNLTSEVTRASKIKCSKCGQKGAALGCYAKSCRKSFHIPCAVQVSGCRWDVDNFLMLCPTHFSYKFPSDRSKSQQKVRDTDLSTPLDDPESSKNLAAVPVKEDACLDNLDVSRRWVLCGSALSSSENNLLLKFAKMTGASISRDWRPNVTHVIASTDKLGACSRTLKYLMAILSGKWILKMEWINACLEAKCLVDEERYEINHDIHGCFDGPKNGRTRIAEKAPPLFNDLKFYFCEHFKMSYKGYLEDLISAAGGSIVKEIGSGDGHSKFVKNLSHVVYNLDPPEELDLVDQADAIKTRLEEAEAIARQSGSRVVAHTWVLDSIAACAFQPVVY